MSRVGIGFDAHRFVAGRPLRLGGVELQHELGLEGHSDGDALLHAICDAILGAAGLGSLGDHFSDDDREWEGMDSAVLLARAGQLAREKGFALGNVDAVVIAESPKIAPRREAIRLRIAEVLEVAASRVSVRGKSSNGLGFAGRGEGIAAAAVVLLEGGEGESGPA